MPINNTKNLTTQRIEKFNNLANHPFYGRSFARLGYADTKFILEFLLAHGEANNDQFTYEINRIGISGFTPCNLKNHQIITDLLLASRV